MTLITVRRRETATESEMWFGTAGRVAVVLLAMPASWFGAQAVWQWAGGPVSTLHALDTLLSGQMSAVAIASLLAPVGIVLALRLARVADRALATIVWAIGIPWCLPPLAWLLPREVVLAVWLVPLPWVYFGLWPLTSLRSEQLHHARWARPADLRQLRVKPGPQELPPEQGLVLGRLQRNWLLVRSQAQQRELGGMLVVGRPRSGKGLLAVSQILGAWQQHSLVCTDLKGELHDATAGWRARTGKVIVLDPTGVGHRFDPLAGRDTEDDLYRAAQDILHVDGEGDGQAFTERAASMLAAIFVAAKREEI
ncbi:MAG: type IV secretory system conjugative DNA transfer family protein, partial [Chloroflexi bacterium]|nr:type IV secretory system conjugative DNA transfer family protein [Chloroflexota bacterium]